MEVFKKKVIKQGNSDVVSIPKNVKDFLNINTGDWVSVNIEKIKK